MVDGLEKLENRSVTGGKFSHLLPVAFRLPGYVDARHEEFVRLVEKDEEWYGRADLYNGHHEYGDHMLTQEGEMHVLVRKRRGKK